MGGVVLLTWELFKDELERNISLNLDMIKQQLFFFVKRKICDHYQIFFRS